MEQDLQSIWLAGLLHDIGKFVHKTERADSMKHPHASHTFVNSNDFPAKFKTQVLLNCVQKHHEHNDFPAELRVDSLKGTDLYELALLGSEADNLSSGERKTEKTVSHTFYKNTPLDCIFQEIDLGLGDKKSGQLSYQAKKYHPNFLFPVTQKEVSYTNLINEFGQEFKNLSDINDFHTFYTSLYHLLWYYLWCMPSDINRPDISIFDHLKTTSAIAGCMYLYHQANQNFNEKAIKNSDQQKFLLIAGDFSGIQQYLFSLKKTSQIAKRLRARSFFIGLLSQAAVLYFLKELDLEICCNLLNGGGNFFILAPNTQATKEGLQKAKKIVAEWLLKEFRGELYLNIAELPCSGKDLKNFSSLVENIHHLLMKEKNSAGKELLIAQDNWKKDEFLFGSQEPCEYCEKFPYEEKYSTPEEKICRYCELDQDLGNKLTKANHLAFSFDKGVNHYEIFGGLNFNVYKNYKEIPDRQYLVLKLNPLQEDLFSGKISQPFGFQFLSNYVPRSTRNDLESTCEKCSQNKDCDFKKELNDHSNILSFQCLASKAKGADYLACVKGDLDRLGLIFSMGLKDELRSVSRIATMSRMLDGFFSGHLESLLESKYKNFYTVYSGGDDFLFFAPWSDALNFAETINNDLKKFTGNNPNITLSVGIALHKPHLPVPQAVQLAENVLEQAKKQGRNRVGYIKGIIPWDRLDQVKSILEELKKYRNLTPNDEEREKLPTAFLYRWYKYSEILSLYTQKKEVAALKVLGNLSYDIKRNFKDEDLFMYIANNFLQREAVTEENNNWDYIPQIITHLILEGRNK